MSECFTWSYNSIISEMALAITGIQGEGKVARTRTTLREWEVSGAFCSFLDTPGETLSCLSHCLEAPYVHLQSQQCLIFAFLSSVTTSPCSLLPPSSTFKDPGDDIQAPLG